MSLEMYKQNENIMEAMNKVVADDMITDTRWLTEEELLEHYEVVKSKNAIPSLEVEYNAVFNNLIDQISEATDTKLKNTLETLCFILIKEHKEDEIVSEDILSRLTKITTLEVIKEESIEIFEAAAMGFSLPVTDQNLVNKMLSSFGKDIAAELMDTIGDESQKELKFAMPGGRDSFTTDMFWYDPKSGEFKLSVIVEPVDVKLLKGAVQDVIDYLGNFGLAPSAFGKPKFGTPK
jgi:hypothetical protein